MRVKDFITLRADPTAWVGKTMENVISYDSRSLSSYISKTISISKRIFKYLPNIFDDFNVQMVAFKSGIENITVYGLFDDSGNKVLEILDNEVSLNLKHKDIQKKTYSIQTLIEILKTYYNIDDKEIRNHYRNVIRPLLEKNKEN